MDKPTTKEMVWRVKEPESESCSSPEAIAERFGHLRNECREHFAIATLTVHNRIIDVYTITIGTLSEALVHPREVFKPAVMDSAAAVVLIHNHPTGRVRPSRPDKALTARLQEAGTLLGIKVIDHVIVGREGIGYYSFRDAGLIKD